METAHFNIKTIEECSINEEQASVQEKVPILFVDISLGNSKVHQLCFYKEDDVSEVVHNFCLEHSNSSIILKSDTLGGEDKIKAMIEREIRDIDPKEKRGI